MITLPPDFKEFLQLLNEHKVKYLLVGGYAVSLHGYIRYTSDMDIWILSNKTNAKKIVNVLKDFNIPNAEELFSIFISEKRVFGMGMPPYKIEVINQIDGVNFNECYRNKLLINVDNIPVYYIGLKDLRINKKASGRYKDLNDLEHLPPE